MKNPLKKCLNAILPAFMLCGPAIATSVRSASRALTKSAVVRSVVSEQSVEQTYSPRNAYSEQDPFAVFGKSIKRQKDGEKAEYNQILNFLEKENLLARGTEKKSTTSGDVIMGRKDFAAQMCQNSTGSTYSWYTTQAACTGCTWTTLFWVTTPPNIESSSVSNITSSNFRLNVNISHPGTVYAVAVLRTGAVPNSTQVKNGQDGSGAAAAASGSVALNTGEYSDYITLSAANADQNLYNRLLRCRGRRRNDRNPESAQCTGTNRIHGQYAD